MVRSRMARTMAHKLGHGPSEDPTRPLRGFLEADETFIGGRGDPTRRGGGQGAGGAGGQSRAADPSSSLAREFGVHPESGL